MDNKKQTCYNCKSCKIWYDKDNYTMRLSCTATKSKLGKTITWKMYPLYERKNGAFIQTDDTIESITNEFKEYSKRRTSPFWCPFRKESRNAKL